MEGAKTGVGTDPEEKRMRIGGSPFPFSQLSDTSQAIGRSLERLSSGRRINSPRDDLAGFVTSQRLDSQVRGLSQASRNINEALGMIQTADSAIASQTEIVQRMRELSLQAANGSLSGAERLNLNQEVNALMQEFKRITSSTEFAGTKLLDGSFDLRSIQVGANQGDSREIEMGNLQASQIFEKTVGTGSFLEREAYEVGADPRSIAPADLNGSGREDFVTVDSSNDTISLLFNRGDGTFEPTKTIGLNSSIDWTSKIQTADLNSNGIEDLVVSSRTDGTIAVLLGNGDGTFSAEQTFSVDSNPLNLELADVTGNGHLDAITASLSANTVSILEGKGDGSFSTMSTLEVGNAWSAYSVRAGDLTGNGKLDLVTAGHIGPEGEISVFLNEGGGSFSERQTFEADRIFDLSEMRLGDLNNNGHLDVVVTGGNGESHVSVLLGKGDGSFEDYESYNVGTDPFGLRLGDFTGNGRLDIATADLGPNQITLLENLGDGSFDDSNAKTFDVGSTPFALAAADLNGNGVLDLATVDWADDTISVLHAHTRDVTALSDINLSTQEKAEAILPILDQTLNRLNNERAQLGALHSGLDQSRSHAMTQSESLSQAHDEIVSTDYAVETAELVRNQLLQHAQVAMVAQANVNQQVVLQLLGGNNGGVG